MTTTSPPNTRRPTTIDRPTIILASENLGKIRELRMLVGDLANVIDLRVANLVLPEEIGISFAQNAIAKAEFATARTGFLALADDSGLEVDALDGLPGVRTARFAGENASDADNRAKLLAALMDIEPGRRGARFVSTIAISRPSGETITFNGDCEGQIALAERGSGGFGYDSIFQLSDGTMMAELTSKQKNAISHRGSAMRKAAPVLRGFVEKTQPENRSASW